MKHIADYTKIKFFTVPTEMSILQKEHFNRWYSLKAFYISVNVVDIPVSVLCCTLFSFIVYFMSGQPPDVTRFAMFFTISLLVSFVAQSFGLMIGAVFNVVVRLKICWNSTFTEILWKFIYLDLFTFWDYGRLL